eukprot:5374988-Alexandrium_andersonii.AAC.1
MYGVPVHRCAAAAPILTVGSTSAAGCSTGPAAGTPGRCSWHLRCTAVGNPLCRATGAAYKYWKA